MKDVPTDNAELNNEINEYNSEPVTRRCSVKQVFRKFSLNSQEITCARVSFLIELQAENTAYTIFANFISNYLRNIRLKLAKNQAKDKQHPETELLLFENYSLSSPALSFKKQCAKFGKKQVCLF